MKKLYSLLTVVFITVNIFAQTPEKMSYQAVIRNANNVLITSQFVGVQVSILQGNIGGVAVYEETHFPTTNINGLISLEIGNGSIISGDFTTIDWANGPYFIQTETDPTGGTNYTISGTSQLLSVPYALYARTSGDSFSGDFNDLANIPTDQINDADADPTNELQVLSISNDTIYLENGGFAKLPAGFDGQYSSLTGAPTNVSSFANDAAYLTSFTEVDGSTSNEIQTLSISNSTISLSNGGGSVTMPSEGDAWGVTGEDLTSAVARTGYVAIGSATTPTEALEVNGTMKITDGTEGDGKVLTSDVNGKSSWVKPVDNVISTTVQGTGSGLPIGAHCPVGGSYTGPATTLEPGVYLYTLYSCANQIGQTGAGFNISINFISGSGDATSTWHDYTIGSCGHYYTGVVRVTSTSSVATQYSSYAGSTFTVPGANTENITFIRLN